MIRCRSCHKSKHRSQFYKACINKAGTLGECKDCVRERVRKNREEKADYYREYDAKRYQEDPRVRARHRRYQATPAGKEVMERCRNRWSQANPKKRAAHNAVNNAVRDGRLVKSTLCEDCGAQASRIEGHHEDYSKPLDVIWLCRSCHAARHRGEVA